MVWNLILIRFHGCVSVWKPPSLISDFKVPFVSKNNIVKSRVTEVHQQKSSWAESTLAMSRALWTTTQRTAVGGQSRWNKSSALQLDSEMTLRQLSCSHFSLWEAASGYVETDAYVITTAIRVARSIHPIWSLPVWILRSDQIWEAWLITLQTEQSVLVAIGR